MKVMLNRDLFKDHVPEFNEKLEKVENMKHAAFAKGPSVTAYHPDFSYLNEKYESAIGQCDESIEEIAKGFTNSIEESRLYKGVSCWHKSEHESEAMWKLYTNTGQGIAIESTIKQLEYSIISDREIFFENVIYVAEDEQKNTEHLKYEMLKFKRKSFEHEKEFRAIVDLKEAEKGEGTFVNCDLNKLINRIHISPYLEPYFVEIVKEICIGKLQNIDSLVTCSKLLDKPDYSLRALAEWYASRTMII